MNIEIPPAVGIIPLFEFDYESDPTREKYRAVIDIVGSYEDRSDRRIYTHEARVWTGDLVHDSEEAAVEYAVDKLAEMLKKLI